MMKKKVILVLPGIPVPPIDGFKLKSYRTVLALKKYFDLKLIIISRVNINDREKELLKELNVSYMFYKITILDYAKAIFKTILNNKPFQANLFHLQRVAYEIKQIHSSYDYIILNLVRTGLYYQQIPKDMLFIDMVDVISMNYKRSINTTKSFFFKLIYKFEFHKLELFERTLVSNARCTWLVNINEVKEMQMKGKVECNPNGVNEEIFHQAKPEVYHNNVSFFGAMFYQPNIDAVLWFLENVWNELSVDCTFYIIGTNPPNSLYKVVSNYSNVKITGYLENPYTLISSSKIIIAPMISGGGLQNKILESMALGKIVLATKDSAEAISGIKHMENIIVCNNNIEFINWINTIMIDYESYSYIGENAKEMITNNYSWKSYEEKMYNSILNNS